MWPTCALAPLLCCKFDSPSFDLSNPMAAAADSTLRAVLNTDQLPPPESAAVGDASPREGDGNRHHEQEQGYLSDEGAELYSQKVHTLETEHPHGFLEHEKLKHGHAPHLRIWTPDLHHAATTPPASLHENGHPEM